MMSKTNNETNLHFEPWFEMVVVAKIPDTPIGRNKIFKKLRDLNYLMEGNIPYQKYVDSGHFKMELRPRYDSNKEIVQWYAVTLVSVKGAELIKKLLKEEEGGTEQQL
jgi:phage antirepressor YoqD-like protein